MNSAEGPSATTWVCPRCGRHVPFIPRRRLVFAAAWGGIIAVLILSVGFGGSLADVLGVLFLGAFGGTFIAFIDWHTLRHWLGSLLVILAFATWVAGAFVGSLAVTVIGMVSFFLCLYFGKSTSSSSGSTAVTRRDLEDPPVRDYDFDDDGGDGG